METMEFDLLREPWIRARTQDYTVQEVSLTDALLYAHQYVDLAGEMPTQDAAMLRLLLAVLHTVFSRMDVNGESAPLEDTDDALERWGELWQLGYFPEEPIRNYLEKWEDRFWLFHPERPFWQVSQVKNGIEFRGKKLNGERSESENKVRLFQNVSENACERLTYAQAARWLIYLNSYDERGGRPKAGNKPRHGVAWLGQIGFVMIKGKNLFETLMRNMVLAETEEDLLEEQKPCWECEKVRTEQSVEIPVPQNAAELLTLQSRRILLKHSVEKKIVTGYEVLGGDYIDTRNAFAEKMTVWRKSSKKNEKTVYLPKRHDPGKQLWREFSTILDEDGHRPGVLNWNIQLQNAEILGRREQLVFRIVGIRYDEQEASVQDCYTDQLSMQLNTLNNLKRPWLVRIQREVQSCNEVAEKIGELEKELKLARGLDYNKIKKFADMQKMTESARAQFYFSIDQPFRQWLREIDPDKDDLTQKMDEWQKIAYRIAAQQGEKMVKQAGAAAFVGQLSGADGGAAPRDRWSFGGRVGDLPVPDAVCAASAGRTGAFDASAGQDAGWCSAGAGKSFLCIRAGLDREQCDPAVQCAGDRRLYAGAGTPSAGDDPAAAPGEDPAGLSAACSGSVLVPVRGRCRKCPLAMGTRPLPYYDERNGRKGELKWIPNVCMLIFMFCKRSRPAASTVMTPAARKPLSMAALSVQESHLRRGSVLCAGCSPRK